MKTITQHIREHLLSALGIVSSTPLPPLEVLKESEWSPKFEKLMREGLLIGAFRYGLLNAPNKKQFNRIKDIRHRSRLYEKTGNVEYLRDIANMALLEFEEGYHPNKHFRHTDDGYHTEEKR